MWHPWQELTDLPGGGVRRHLRLTDLAEIERWVLSWGTHATVVGPEALRKNFREMADTLRERYREPAAVAPAR